ncbi:hypothetical protein L1887_06449 [Cichorium endivia]|nr:hypothetical protein L1887_06449 [Cichorium endivia]
MEHHNHTRVHHVKSNRDGRSFAEVLTGTKTQLFPQSIPIKVDTGMNSWLKKSVLIGEAHSLNHIATFHIYNKLGVTTKYLGGLNMALEFVHSEDAREYLEDKSRWEFWFKRLKYGDEEDNRFERMAWLKIIGLPLRLWDEDNFSKIAGNFGRVVNPFDGICNRRDLSMGKVGVVTSRRTWINEELQVDAGGKLFKVGVIEYTDDWSPFRECPFDNTVESDDETEEVEDEDSDGISDTWVGMEEEPEEGEFIPSIQANQSDPADVPAINPVKPVQNPNDVSGREKDREADQILEEKVEESGGNKGTSPGKKNTADNTRGCFAKNVNVDLGESSNPPIPHVVGSVDGGLPNKEATNDLGRLDNLCGPHSQTTGGRLDPITQRFEPNTKTHVLNSPSTAGSSESSIGRAKRRKIKKRRSMEAVGKDYVAHSNRRSKEKSFDLNNRPQVNSNSSSSQSREDVSSSMGCDSHSMEVRATYDVGREVGFQFDAADQTLEQIMGGGDDSRVIQ